jgi:hypothetical protein
MFAVVEQHLVACWSEPEVPLHVVGYRAVAVERLFERRIAVGKVAKFVRFR